MSEKHKSRVLGIMGSPRKGGNTDILVDEVLRGARDAGAEAEKVTLVDLHIEPCDACNSCRKSGICVHSDDMETVLDKMRECDVWVLGTPVYWWGPTAQFKAYMDRWYQTIGEPDRKTFRGKRVIIVVPFGDTDPAVARNVVGMFEDALAYTRSELFARIVAHNTYEAGEARERPEHMAAAYQAGRSAVAQ